MTINLATSIIFTDHLNKSYDIEDKTISFELEATENKLYYTAVLTIQELYINPNIVADGVERITFKYKKDDEEIKSYKFSIQDVVYENRQKAKLYLKTKGYTLNNRVLNTYMNADTIRPLLASLLSEYVIDTTRLSDFSIVNGSYNVEKNTAECIEELSTITGFEYAMHQDAIRFYDKKVIQEDDVAVYSFDSLTNITSISQITDKENIVNAVYINTKKEEEITSEPKITLNIDPSPQPLSPSSVLVLTEDDTEYKIRPISATATFYYSPLNQIPRITGVSAEKKTDYNVIEKYEIDSESYLTLTGGIASINDVHLNNESIEYNFMQGYNVLYFNEEITGKLDVSYKTDIYRATIPPSDKEKEIKIKATLLNQTLSYTHNYAPTDYYPIPYTDKIDLVKDWNIDPNYAVSREITLLKYNATTKTYEIVTTLNANAFGEIDFTIEDYGVYVFDTVGYDKLYLLFYINEYTKTLNEPKE